MSGALMILSTILHVLGAFAWFLIDRLWTENRRLRQELHEARVAKLRELCRVVAISPPVNGADYSRLDG